MVYADQTITFGTTCGNEDSFGRTATNRELFAQPFTPSINGSKVTATVYMATLGSPTDSATVDVYSDSAGVPNVSISSGAATISHSSLPADTGCSSITSTVMSPITVTLVSGTQYWLVFGRTGTLDDTNRYALAECTTCDGSLKQYAFTSSNTWTQRAAGYEARGSLVVTAAVAVTPTTGYSTILWW